MVVGVKTLKKYEILHVEPICFHESHNDTYHGLLKNSPECSPN